MPTLRAPDGRRYRTDDEREINTLTLGHGYTIEPDPVEQPKAASPRPRKAPPAAERAESDDR
ncbi:hypothetical protein SAMN05421810_10176 [Amycolatopsis arida]|uniref:Uncharacterized protein n=1 Tax=Amycolatopsis arida TaxID=587909 RepID=A0A1I5KC94_9PSEU|nr:hypothetical protein [Amycolatopsis arida]TDX96972.1 hypothetical protein CLV69_10274 [Amycolatopsis arida]SFO82353.1 hypothetical protein SAMN05421810_10176 [Amycolatopsis arida]